MPSFYNDERLSKVLRTIPSIEFSMGITATMSSESSSFEAELKIQLNIDILYLLHFRFVPQSYEIFRRL